MKITIKCFLVFLLVGLSINSYALPDYDKMIKNKELISYCDKSLSTTDEYNKCIGYIEGVLDVWNLYVSHDKNNEKPKIL